jgi:hypothetical protein
MNLTPDNPTAAQLWARAFRERTGESVDSVLSVDITALGELLAADGGRVALFEGVLVAQPAAEAGVEGTVHGGGESVAGAELRRRRRLSLPGERSSPGPSSSTTCSTGSTGPTRARSRPPTAAR